MQCPRSLSQYLPGITATSRLSDTFAGLAFASLVIATASFGPGCQQAKGESSEAEKKAGPVKKVSNSKQFGGLADYYHHSLYGQRTASGQVLKKDLLTAAHRTLPFGTRVHVRNKRTGKSCVVVINDRGPYTKSKVIDLSHAAAIQLGLIQAGTADVACTVLKDGEKDGERLPGKKATVIDAAAPTSEED